ncbi:hypothetical protein [Moraxella catarrhalis]|uniref:hypothetical protein n=1 Tax=Moraxella catarrhalis TaxID=480 RepID=UPI0007F435F6|nr:hypothetical protein [Moraxella catarrhalis]OAV06964.1 hypothetical protein AO379_0458 [Moraxella catarrhalis]
MIIKSHQDTYQYTHDQKQAGFSADVGFDGKPQSFSINGSKTNVDTDYAQVIHQTGIKAQESTLQVQGKSEFTGGYFITDQGKNQTQFTQGIQTQDIQNHLNYQGDAISLGIGVADTSNPNGKAKPTLQGIGYGTITPAQPPTLPSLIKQGFLISTPQSVDGFAKHGTVSKNHWKRWGCKRQIRNTWKL